MKKTILLVMAILGVSGCVASPQELIAQGDWQQLGYQDGVKGAVARTPQRLQQLGEGNQGKYEDGYQQGITEYCQPNHAYQIGLSGQNYHGVCSGMEGGNQFRMEWQRGWNAFNK